MRPCHFGGCNNEGVEEIVLDEEEDLERAPRVWVCTGHHFNLITNPMSLVDPQ